MLSKLWDWFKRLDLDSKLTLCSLSLMFVAWTLDYIRDPKTTNQLFIPILILLMISFFLLMLSESLRRERRIIEFINTEQNFLKTEFPQAVSKAIRVREELTKLGLTAVTNGRDDARFFELLNSSSNEVCLMAISLYHYVSLMRTALPPLLARKRLRMKILIVRQDAPSLKEKEREENIPNRIKTEIEGVCGMLRQIKLEAIKLGYSGEFEVRQYYGNTYCSLYIFDQGTVWYNPYLRNTPGKDLPVFEFNNVPGGPYSFYRSHFDRVWNDEKTRAVAEV